MCVALLQKVDVSDAFKFFFYTNFICFEASQWVYGENKQINLLENLASQVQFQSPLITYPVCIRHLLPTIPKAFGDITRHVLNLWSFKRQHCLLCFERVDFFLSQRLLTPNQKCDFTAYEIGSES